MQLPLYNIYNSICIEDGEGG